MRKHCLDTVALNTLKRHTCGMHTCMGLTPATTAECLYSTLHRDHNLTRYISIPAQLAASGTDVNDRGCRVGVLPLCGFGAAFLAAYRRTRACVSTARSALQLRWGWLLYNSQLRLCISQIESCVASSSRLGAASDKA
jgi:hypothetical protein